MQAPFADPLSRLDRLNTTLPLVGRESEMQVARYLLNNVLRDLPTGARALTISGEMGVGKSRLLAELLAEATQLGFCVLESRAYEAVSMFPYFPFIEAVRSLLHTAAAEKLRSYLGFAATSESNPDQGDAPGDTTLLSALAHLFPEAPDLLSAGAINLAPTGAQEVLSPEQEKFRILEAVATLLERAAREQPIVLAIDNLQWADSASLELTMYLTVRLHRSRVALVGVTRPPTASREAWAQEDQPASPATNAAARALAGLISQGLLLPLPLGPLAPDAAAVYLHALLPGAVAPEVEQALLDQAGGNPFFLEELVRALALNRHLAQREGMWQMAKRPLAELPGSVTLAVRQRLQELSLACREMLRVAALFGRAFPFDALPAVWESAGNASDLHALIDEAVNAAIIASAPAADENEADSADHTVQLSPYLFCHGIVQEVLRAEVSRLRLSELHNAIGAALETCYGDSAHAHAAELARHYTAGGNKTAALRWNWLAGEYAASQQAHREAIRHFRLALSFVESHKSDASEGKGEEGRDNKGEDKPSPLPLLASPMQDVPSAAQLSLTIGELWFRLAEFEQAAPAFQKALELLAAQQGVSARGDALDRALQFARANRLLSDVYRMQAKYDQALAHLQVASGALTIETEETAAYQPAGQETTARWFPGHGLGNRGSVLALERAGAEERVLLLQSQAMLDILMGRKKEAEAFLWQSHQLATRIGDRGSQAFALHLVGWLRGWGEHIHEAIRLQEQARELYIAIGDPFHAALGDQGLSIIYQALGEMERARAYAMQGLERARRYGVRFVLGWLYWNLAAIALAQGDWDGCAAHLQEAEGEAEATDNVRLKPLVLQARAELALRRGDWHEAERSFQAAIELSANTEWHAGALALYGHFLAVTGRLAAARAQLDRAAAFPEPPGYGGDFYIPFLAEGYLHLDADEQAAAYVQRIQAQRGFMYYGSVVDRVLGVVAARAGDWGAAEQAFERGLSLCRRAHNQPEEAAILYEQARAALMRSRAQAAPGQQQSLQRLHTLCSQARALFAQYAMQRAVALVDTLQEGARQLEARALQTSKAAPTASPRSSSREELSPAGYILDRSLTKRELEVLRLVAEGHTDREVADTLIVSPRTVNHHLSNIFVKLDVPGRAAAVAYAIRQGWVS
jgi:predicted ATPase/DNA-binding CsgD family transcriptional regulator